MIRCAADLVNPSFDWRQGEGRITYDALVHDFLFKEFSGNGQPRRRRLVADTHSAGCSKRDVTLYQRKREMIGREREREREPVSHREAMHRGAASRLSAGLNLVRSSLSVHWCVVPSTDDTCPSCKVQRASFTGWKQMRWANTRSRYLLIKPPPVPQTFFLPPYFPLFFISLSAFFLFPSQIPSFAFLLPLNSLSFSLSPSAGYFNRNLRYRYYTYICTHNKDSGNKFPASPVPLTETG